MGFIWRTAVKDWRRQRRNPLEFLLWLGIPLLIGGLIILAFGGRDGPRPQAQLLVADEDDSFVSGLLVAALGHEKSGGMIRTRNVTAPEGHKLMDDGDATALLIIPSGFGDAVLNERPVSLQLTTNPAQTILPGIVTETLSIFADGAFYLHRLAGDQIRLIARSAAADTVPNDRWVADTAVAMHRIGTRVATYLSPPLIGLDDAPDAPEDPEQESDEVGIGLLFLPSILLMSLLFMAQGLANDIWQERQLHTLQRVAAAPPSLTQFLAGKLLAAAGMMMLVSGVGLGIGYAYFRLAPAGLLAATIWATCAGCLLLAILMTVQLFAPSQRAGNILTMALIFPLMMIGGSFFPFEAMPDWMVAVGRWTPNGWSLLLLKRIILGEAGTAELIRGLLVAGGAVGVLFTVGARVLRTGFSQG
jgi:ABC-type multidrug transport system permease subunit